VPEALLAFGERAEQAGVIGRHRGQVGETLDKTPFALRGLVGAVVVHGEGARRAGPAADRARPA
jgi:hypothetical protein